ncbi:MAG: TetR family transcriptional regulator [Syntrophobacterales bacterium]|nr:TetR family transcriptional regulator [Syntrophobacterales bacterium]
MGHKNSNGKRTEKYEKILDAAVKVFAKKGFYQSRVSDIAREAGVADGTIYIYFKNKDDILISIFEEKMRIAISIFQQELAQGENALSKLRRFVHVHLDLFRQNPELAAVLQVELRQSSRFMKEYKKVELKRFLDLIGDIVKQGQEEGFFRKDLPVSLVKRFVFGALDEIISTWVSSGGKFNLMDYADALSDLFIRGLGTVKVLEGVVDSSGEGGVPESASLDFKEGGMEL